MQVNITGITGPQLSGLVASAGIGAISLKWDNPNSAFHKATEVWMSASSDVSSATKIATTTDYTYVVVDAGSTPMYYWVRSISAFNRSDAAFSASVSKAGNAVTGTAAKMLSLGASSQIFSVSKAGIAAPATISLYASAQNLQGTPTWSITSGTATLNVSGNANTYQKDLTYASMTTDQVTVQITQDGMTDQLTIVKVKDGIDTITGMLTNEAANVAADVVGNVSSFVNSGGSFKVFQGTVDKTSSATFSVVSTSSVGIGITTAGIYSVTSLTADNGSATLRAVYAGVTIDKIYTVTKSKQGAQGPQGNTGQTGQTGSGTPGQRGTVNLAASGYSYWSDSVAYSVISSSGYGSPMRGDIVTLYDSTHSFTYFYDGSRWAQMTAHLNGNMLISGTLTADKITTGTLRNLVMLAGSGRTPAGAAFEVTSTGVVWTSNLYGGTLKGDNWDATTREGIIGTSINGSNAAGIAGYVSNQSGAAGGATASAGWFQNMRNSKGAVIGSQNNGFDVYAFSPKGATNYGPFTGGHEALMLKDSVVEPGDIMVDVKCVVRGGLSGTIFECARSTEANQCATIGVFVVGTGSLMENTPSAFVQGYDTHVDEHGLDRPYPVLSPEFSNAALKYNIGIVNALGEGQMNVVSQGGNIKAGDFICCSDVPGKGMRQASDSLMKYTVAKAREDVVFEANEVRQVACIYLCG